MLDCQPITRLDAILDERRPLAKRLGLVGVVTMESLIASAILLAAALGPGDETRVKELNQSHQEDANREATETSGAVPADRGDEKAPFVYAGQVLTPAGQPAVDAEIRLVYSYWDKTQLPPAKPLAITDKNGRFRFEMTRADFLRTADNVPPWRWASLVAAKEGLGLAWVSSVALEQTGAVQAEISDRSKESAIPSSRFLEMIAKQRGPLHLSPDDSPIQGKVVNTEGQPIANVRVSLLELYTGEDNTLDRWHAGAENPRAEFYRIRDETPRHLYGPLVQTLLSAVKTDAQGEFVIRGIGRERLVRLLIEAPTIATTDVFCRTRAGEKIELGGMMPGHRITVFDRNIVHVATPSKPITGVVRDKKSGRTLSGVVVKSMQLFMRSADGGSATMGNDFARSVTDRQGRYTLTGLPNTVDNPVRFSTLR